MFLGRAPNVHAEHDNLWSHGGHLVAEAVSVDTVHVGSKGVLAVGLALSSVDHTAIGALNLGGGPGEGGEKGRGREREKEKVKTGVSVRQGTERTVERRLSNARTPLFKDNSTATGVN